MISNLLYTILLIDAFIIGYLINKFQLFKPMWGFLARIFHNKKLIILLISNILGSMPIPGRIVASAPMLKNYINNKDKLGVFTYLVTHHYYFWSPLEKSIILILGGLSLTYSQFLYYIWPLLLIYVLLIVLYTFIYIKESDINDFDFSDTNNMSNLPFIFFFITLISSIFISPIITFSILTIYYIIITKETIKNCLLSIKWDIILLLIFIIISATLIKDYVTFPEELSTINIISILSIGFGFSLLLGSSSRYAGIVVMIMLILDNLYYLPLVFAIEYMGYYLSPFHKCVPIAIGYFKSNVFHFYKHVIIISSSVLIVGGLYTLLMIN